MTNLLLCLIAASSLAAFLILWFWVVYRELRRKKDAIEIAGMQIQGCVRRVRQAAAPADIQDAQAILLRSEDIYRQAVARYHQSLQKPYMRIPGFLMGFRCVKDGGNP